MTRRSLRWRIPSVQATADSELARVVRETLDYVLRDLTSPEGGFYSAEDADSLPEPSATEKREGAFYVWTQQEIDRVLTPDESLVFRRMYGVERTGNVAAASDPHRELIGLNVLFLQNDLELIAKLTGKGEEEIAQLVSAARQKLKSIRDERPRPHLDDKIVTAWNGLMISGLAKAYQVLGESRYLVAAQRASEFLATEFVPTKIAAQLSRDGRHYLRFCGRLCFPDPGTA